MMTQEEQRIALAEWDGYTVYNGKPRAGGKNTGTEVRHLPNYHSDLNAVHELEKRLNDYQKRKYAMMIHTITDAEASFGCDLNYWLVLHTTAPQRCEALCRVLFPERWKDGV